MNTWVRVARIGKPRHLEGSVIATAADTLPFLVHEGMNVYFIPPTLKGPRSARVDSIKPIDAETYVLHFEGIDTIEDAEAISGTYALAVASDVIWPDPKQDERTLVGYDVIDEERGSLGYVAQIEGSALQRVLNVEARSIRSDVHRSVLIPFVDEFITNIDSAKRIIRVHVPASLLHLNDGPAQ